MSLVGRIFGGWRIIFLALVIAAAVSETQGSDHFATALGIHKPKEQVEAPDVVGADPDGRAIRLSDFRGNVVFLNFWATWCIPCRVEMPAMERLYREFKGRGLVVLGVNVQEGPGPIRAFVEELKLTFPVLLDRKGTAAMTYVVHGLPATYLIDRNQIIVGRAIGAREWDSKDGRAYIQALLGERR